MSFKEGFQTQTPVTTPQTCPQGAIQTFPLMLDFNATVETYDVVNAPLSIDFKWGTRTNAPQFFNTEGNRHAIDEVGEGLSNLTSFKYLGVEYELNRVEIAAATHTGWILPADRRSNNDEDIVITFEARQSTTSAQYRYILFVIPIIRSENVSVESSYLRALLNRGASGPFSIRTCFPSSVTSLFGYYSACLNGIQPPYAIDNVHIFVSTEGIPMLRETMMNLLKIVNPTATAFPAANPPFKNRFTIGMNPMALQRSQFGEFVLSTNQLLNAAGFIANVLRSTPETRHDNLDAYKCVALNPDSDIEGGGINIDVETGTPLKEVLETREAERAALGTKATQDGGVVLNPGRLEKLLSSAIGIFMIIIVVFGVILLISNYFGRGQSPAVVGSVETVGIPAKLAEWAQSSTTYALTFVLVGFAGFIIGVMLQ